MFQRLKSAIGQLLARQSLEVRLLAVSTASFLIHAAKLTVAIQSANLALIQVDPIALERDPQGSTVCHCHGELLEPTRNNSGSAAFADSRLPLQDPFRP